MKKTIEYLLSKKRSTQKITSLTAYDYPTALLLEQAGIDIIILGDSVGTNILGYENETFVTLEDMEHHTRAVKRGIKDIFLIVDLPFKSYETIAAAEKNAKRLVSCGADAVKMEGINAEIVTTLTRQGITVVGHIGLNPQFDQQLMREGKITRGKTFEEAHSLIEGAVALEKAGVKIIILEKIPFKISEIITAKLAIPTIGIGAGPYCDGQVLIINDILNLGDRKYKHVKQYADIKSQMLAALSLYKQDVEAGRFPGIEHSNAIKTEEFDKVAAWYSSQPPLG
jgi:3-methyl-2-oxobutanoate hydroxymethyltransferase